MLFDYQIYLLSKQFSKSYPLSDYPELSQYIDTYIFHVKGKKILSSNGYERKYKYSTLKYFHNELGINMKD